MYSPESERALAGLAKALLQEAVKSEKPGNPQATLESLRTVLHYSDWRYYVQDDPVLSDFEYDQLFSWLKKLEQSFPEFITEDSPTRRVASGLTKEFPTVRHLVPMLSLDNSYNEQDLRDWDRTAKKLTGLDEIEYCAEPKFDGAGISLIYENDILKRGATRGDGVEGDDITVNIRQIKSVPLAAKFSAYGIRQIEIRGEVLIHKEFFKKFNEQRISDNLPPLANPRNAASGSLRMVDPREVGKRGLEAFLYHTSFHILQEGKNNPPELGNHYDTLKLLQRLGFRTPAGVMKRLKGIEAVIDYCHEFEAKRDELPYEIDGMVVKVNDYALQERMGMTTHHPRWAMAFKFKARQATSKLRRVEFQVGRTGSITPVAKIDPVPIGGVTVGSISLFNEDVVREKDLRIGDTVLVERAGDVIPYIVKSLADLRDGSEEEIRFPTHCPVCGDQLYKPEGESVWRCVNINCEAQVLERLIHFVSKDAMDIRNLGEANIRRFYELGLLKDIPGIYTLDFEKVEQLDRIGKKSISNLQKAIDKSKSQPLHRLVFGLGIRHVGETTAKTLAKEISYLLELKEWSEEQIQQLEDIGPKVASAIKQFFDNKDNLEMIARLESLGLSLRQEKSVKEKEGKFSGKTFLFTGTLSKMKRSEAETLVEEEGGKILGGVSGKLNYLVVGEEAGSKLEKAKKTAGVNILTEDDFLKMMGNEG